MPCARERGAAVVEFAIVASVYLLVLIAIIEFGVMFWASLTMQYAVREGARFAITGQIEAPYTTRYESVIAKVQNSSMGLWSKVSPVITIRINNGAPVSYANSAAYTPGMFGAAGQIVVLQLDCKWPLITPLIQPFFTGGEYRFSVAATMRNEAFE
jgi:Flp pilus assembly protein TadG